MNRNLIRHLLLSALLFFATGAAGQPAPGASARLSEHVVLISIDGLRPEFYLDPSYAAPMLRQLKARGVFAEGMTGVFPTVTYPSHTTLVTGVRPAAHGIFYNTPFEPAGVTGRWYWEASAIRVPTLFSALRADGRRSANLGWPVTVGAPIDWNLPEIWPHENGGDFMATTRSVATPGLIEELEREATGRLLKENFDIGGFARDDRFAAAAAYLLTRHQPALLALHLVATDHFQHEDGRDSERVRRAVATADRAVARIYEAAEQAGMLESTTFVIVGDHGHIDRHTTLAPNVALAAAGLHPAAKERGQWRAAFQGAAAAAFLYLADKQDRAAEREARAALEKLPPGVRSLFRVVERDELDRLGAAPDAVFALAPIAGVDISEEATGELLRPAHGATHGYLPDTPQMETGFIAAGAGIRPGGAARRLRMTDVAPLVAQLLGLPFPPAEGQAPLGFLAARPAAALGSPFATPPAAAAPAAPAASIAAPRETNRQLRPEAEDELRQAIERYARLLEKGAVEEIVQSYTATGELLQQGMEDLRGREQIRSFLTLVYKQYKVQKSGIAVDQIDVNGERATVWATFSQKSGPIGKAATEFRARLVAEWKLEGKSWKIARLMIQPSNP